jgi:hypothetical protein
MKEFRSKDPATFSQLWNDMRGKETSSGHSSTVEHSISPRISQAALHAGPNITPQPPQPPQQIVVPAAVSRSGKSELINEIPPGVPLNGYRVVVDNNPEDLPDLGKYPAMRRIRGSYVKKDQPAAHETPEVSKPALTLASPVSHQSASMGTPHTYPPSQLANPTDEAWPEPRRRAVAIAAIHLLKALPGNENNSIIAQDIASMLERNPSYLDLCSALELRGLKFQRSAFAKDLLKHVPDLNGSTSSQGQTQPSIPQEQLQVQYPMGAPTNSTVSIADFAAQQESIFTAIKLDGTGARGKQSQAKGFDAKLNREPLPGTKEAAARKRDFSELVDLTSLSDNEDYVMPRKRQQTETQATVAPNTFQDSKNNEMQSVLAGFTLAANNVTPLRFDTQAHVPIASYSSTNLTTLVQPPILQSEATRPQKNRMIIARKLDKSEAVQRSYYDPKTIARDVLVASGRHPSERPLNLHLAGMIGQYIDLDSDLSTFDWDAIDPGGPPLRSVEYIDIPATKPRLPKNHAHIRRSSIQPFIYEKPDKATLLPKEGKRSPTMPALPSASVPDQHDPPVTKSSKLQQSHNVLDEGKITTSALSTPRPRKISVDIPADYSSHPSARSASRSVTGSIAKSKNMEVASAVKKRIGRPPGAKNKNPSVAGLRNQAASIRIDLPRQPQPQLQPILDQEMPMFVNPEFKCKWIKCHSILHNLDTLRRHVAKRHAPVLENGELFVCWWKKCPLLKKEDDGIVPSKAFEDEKEWLAHVEEEHIQPVGRVYGDGPSTTHTGKQISSY